MKNILATGQTRCFDAFGKEISCESSRQDGALRLGAARPQDRFEDRGAVVFDALTGLEWLKSANSYGFPLTWDEALEHVRSLNETGEEGGGWRLPNRRELRSLVDHSARKPSLPAGHPFTDVVLGWHWTSTTSAVHSGYAWYVHMEGGRMFYGRKDQYCIVWPVRGTSDVLPVTGQQKCFDQTGNKRTCQESGEDGQTRLGVPWPQPRFRREGDVVHDGLTGLVWTAGADLGDGYVDWLTALKMAEELDLDGRSWRLPNINELESLVDCSSHHPALMADHPFENVGEAYWTSTTSGFEADWAYCLYMHKGAVGVGYKPGPEFLVWAVSG